MPQFTSLRAAVVGLGLALVAVLAPLSCDADSVIYSNLPPYQSAGTVVSGSATGNGGQGIAVGFNPGGTFDLTQIDVGLTWTSGTNGVDLTLNADSGNLPGTAIASWSFTGLPQFGTSVAVQTESFGPGIVLNSGQMYWITATAPASDTIDSWNETSLFLAPQPPGACNFGAGWTHMMGNTGCFTTNVAFDVLGSAVPTPEPSSAVLLGSGVLALIGWGKRRAVFRCP